MFKLFDRDFFKFLLSFIAILAATFVILYFASLYSSGTSGLY